MHLMPLRVDEDRVLYSILKARSLRELGRLSGVSHSTAKRIIEGFTRKGGLLPVFDDEYFGLARVVYVSQAKRLPSYLPYGSMLVERLESHRGGYVVVVGYIPRDLVSKYLEDLKGKLGEGEVYYGREVAYWVPVEALRHLLPSRLIQLPELVEEILPRFEKPKPLRMPDQIDLELLTGKLIYGPFVRAWEIMKRLESMLGHPIPSYQTISYHYRLHLAPGWLYTTFYEVKDASKAPRVTLMFKGREASKVAKALALLPVSGTSYIDGRRAIYMGQLDPAYLPEIYGLFHAYRVELLEGLFFVKEHFKLEQPLLWRFLNENNSGWVWVEERVRIPSHG